MGSDLVYLQGCSSARDMFTRSDFYSGIRVARLLHSLSVVISINPNACESLTVS